MLLESPVMPESAPVEVLSVEGLTVVRPSPAIANLFEAQLEHLVIVTTLAESVTPPRLIVDLQHVKIIGSAFLGRMVAVHRILDARPNGRLAMCNLNTFCSAALGVSKLDSVLSIYPTVADAVAALK
jgi:anti-anti-sigma regulatory factor